jgi:hypothetical protein
MGRQRPRTRCLAEAWVQHPRCRPGRREPAAAPIPWHVGVEEPTAPNCSGWSFTFTGDLVSRFETFHINLR